VELELDLQLDLTSADMTATQLAAKELEIGDVIGCGVHNVCMLVMKQVHETSDSATLLILFTSASLRSDSYGLAERIMVYRDHAS